MRRALVIGGTGFVGLNVIDALLEAGVAVRATHRRRSFTLLLRRRPVELVRADLDDADSLRAAMEGCDVALLTAGHYPRYSLDREGSVARAVAQVRAACDAALGAGVGRLVFTSSTGSLAPAPSGRPADERDVHASMPEGGVYPAVKWAMEREVEAARGRGLGAVTLLPGGCLGPGDVRVGTSAFLVGVATGRMPWWVDGHIPMVDVSDVARAHVAAAEHRAPASRYCLGGTPIRVGALLRLVAERYGGRMPPEELDLDQARRRSDHEERAAAPRKGRVPVPRALVDIVASGQPVSSRRAEEELGFRARPLVESLDRAHAWFEGNGYLRAAEVAAVEGA